MITITITSDFICPWCFIGEKHLADAIAGLDDRMPVSITFLPFELNPDMPPQGVDRRTYRTRKFGSWEESRRRDAHTQAVAARAGLTIDYDRIERTPNTREAHKLAWLAAQRGRQEAIANALFRAYFQEGHDIGERATLLTIAQAQGLDATDTARALDEASTGAAVEQLLDQARRRFIAGVPHFDIGGIEVSGAQPAELLRRAILTARSSVSETAAA